MNKKFLALCCLVVVAMVGYASSDVKLTYMERYGDHMGVSQACQAKDYYFYNAEGEMVRHVFHTAGTAGVFEVQNVYYYNYNEAGLLASYVNYQWRPAYSDWSRRDSIAYEYDDQGRLISEIGERDTYNYTYDANGNIVTKEQVVTQTGAQIQLTTYSDFVPGTVNKPQTYTADGAYSNYTYDGTMEYDAMNRLVADSRFSISGSKIQRIEYTYDEKGICVDEKWYTSPSWFPEEIVAGSEADTLRYNKNVVRTALTDNSYEKIEWNSVEVDWDENFNPIYAWQQQPSTYREYYAAADETTVAANMKLTNVSTVDKPNCVKITADAPAALGDGVEYNIWRNFELVATVSANNGKIEYVDESVESRVHTYFVQAYDAATSAYYNVTDLTDIDMNADLAPVTDIRLVGGYQTSTRDPQTGTTYETYMIKLEWDAPACDFEVLSYEVYQKPFAMPVATLTGEERYVELNMPDTETADIRIDVVYALGTVEGEYVTFTWDSSKDFDGEQEAPKYTLVKEDDGEVLIYMYDKDNNISRAKSLMKGAYGEEFMPNYQYYYNYVNGLLDEYYFIQHKDMGVWTDPKDHIYYEYDEQGRLIREENVYTYNDMYEYRYDDEGRLVGYTRYGKSDRNSPDAAYDKIYHTVEYSQFDANGNPARMDYIDGLYATGSYFVLYTYDENSNVLVEESWKPDATNPEDESLNTPNYKYENKYDDYGVNVERIKSNNNWEGGFIYASKEVRERVDENNYNYTLYNYVEYTEEWAERSNATEQYAVLDGAYAPRNLTATKIDNVNYFNAVQLTCNVPEKEVPNAQYIIWYDWQPVDTVAAVDGKITYIASDLPNGRTIEFLVQSYDAVNDIVYNISNVAEANYTIELPAATNLHYDGTTVGEFRDGQGGIQPAYWVHFSWDAPVTDLEILGYNVYEQGWAVPYSFTTNTSDSLSVYRESSYDSPDQIKSVGIEVSVVYSIGESERIVEVFTVENAAVDAVEIAQQVYVLGDNLFVGEAADVVIFNAAGALMGNYNNQSVISLASLQRGVYVARVKYGNVIQTVKFTR